MIFRAFEHRALTELARVQELAILVRDRFDAGADPGEILMAVEVLEAAHQSLEAVLPPGVSSGYLSRHMRFLRMYLESNQPELCRDDIVDICQRDLPQISRALHALPVNAGEHDAEFSQKIAPLIRDQHLASAVREAFVILKERLVTRFDANPALDGNALVNSVFGGGGILRGQIPESECEAMRNFLSGLYGVFRNHYGHRVVEPSWFDAASVLGMVDWALRTLDGYPCPEEQLADNDDR